MEKVKKILSALIALALLISVFTLTACDSNYVLVDLKTGYEQGLIDYDDLLNIAYYGGEYQRNEDKYSENFTPKEIGELSTSKESSIIKSLVRENTKNVRDYIFTTKNFKITSYLGEYNDYVVFRYDLIGPFYSGLTAWVENIGGVEFLIYDDDNIYLWKKL